MFICGGGGCGCGGGLDVGDEGSISTLEAVVLHNGG